MKVSGRQVLAAITSLAIGGFVLVGCSDEEEAKGNHQIWFMGSIYDGADGQTLKDYEISLTSGPTTIRGKVDGNTGRYTLGPLQAWNDYAITISRPYYRAFVSYNAGIAPPSRPTGTGTTITADDVYSANTTQTFDFDAYLFPESLTAAAVTVNILKPDPTAAPATGSIRLRPTSLPSIQDQPAGVGAQVWSNDNDILANTYNAPFENGMHTIEMGRLVYGVTYQVAIYGVEGFQPIGTSNAVTVRAGFQETIMVTLVSTAAPLTVVSSTISTCKPYGVSTAVPNTAQITFTFNAPSVEDVTPVASGRGPEVLDNGLSVSTMMANVLKTSTSTSVQERGTTFNLSGSTLTFSWNPSAGLQTQLAGDTINYVIYGGLSQIMLQATGRPETVKPLSTLINMSSIQCYM